MMFQPDYTDCPNCGTVDHDDYDCPCGCHGDEAPAKRNRRMTIAEFIASAGVKMTVTPTDHNANMENDSERGFRMDHWRCVLRVGRSRMSLTFSKGSGHYGKEPTIAEVLDCLASDASTVDNARSFEDFCSELGYDVDSRKAERLYKACERSAASLRRVLGDSAYETLLYKTERE